ncbi:hypothetical protein GGR53DRAFT_464055 [Hypoxylon sp. FL1150]|nr:hypothetical protein GGR53DRAFT_464055 [Hypoxylon sp. FL1150]
MSLGMNNDDDDYIAAARSNMISTTFYADPGRYAGVHFRNLDDYGFIEYEGPDKLVMAICHAKPYSQIAVVKDAWVAKYAVAGTFCRLRYDPPTPYSRVEVIIDAISIPAPAPTLGADFDIILEDSQPAQMASLQRDEEEAASVPVDKGKGIGHPRMSYDYLSEIVAQLPTQL